MGWWWSRSRVNVCMYGGMLAALLTWSVSYLLWLSQGCMPFLPCVSDLAGGDSGPLFMWGMTVAALLLIPTWFDYFYMIEVDLNTEHCHLRVLSKLLLACGVYQSLCVVGVAFNPWGQRLVLHCLCASGLIFGGGVFLFIDACLAYARSRPFGRVLCMTLLAFSALIIMCVFITIGFVELSSSDGEIDMAMMRTNFKGYCTGAAGSLHANENFSVAALCEWTLFLLGSATCCSRLHTELRVWTNPPPAATAHSSNSLSSRLSA